MDVTEADLDRVRRIARWYKRTHAPKADLDDLIGSGMIGLCQAKLRYKPGGRATFWQFASERVIGEMRDELRRLDHLTRRERDNLAEAEDGELEWAERPTPWAAAPLKPFSLDVEIGEPTRGRTVGDLAAASGEIDPAYEEFDLHYALVLAWPAMTDKERFVVTMVDIEGYPGELIGEYLGVTGGRISQIRGTAFARLRAALGGGFWID